MWTKNPKNWLWLFLFGSLWGAVEVVGGEALYRAGVPSSSVWLAAAALFLLAVGRGVLNRPGTSAVVGAVAALYKLANAAPFFCHLLGIFMVGLVFDVLASLLLVEKEKRRAWWRAPLVGALGAYTSNALFAVLMTFVVRYRYWIGDGLRKFSRHIVLAGSLVALVSLFLVPLGLRLGAGGEALSMKRPRWAATGAAALACAAWAAGRLFA
ncbi:MAG: hypothetical protein JW747_00070 [Candidatus Aminicenantes bacterium]|nr:hypothetical protein [Candidatus Aminicenantes bacterium]